MSILEVNNVSKSFGGVKANVDISMSVEKGKIFGLIGPNGSGKTTLFNSIVGTYPIDQGSIKFNDKDAFIIQKNCGEWEESFQDKFLIFKQSCGNMGKYINKIVVNDADEIIEIQQYIEPLKKLMILKKSSSNR